MGRDICFHPRLLQAVSSLALNISRGGTSITCLGNLCQNLTAFTGKIFFPRSNLTLLSVSVKLFAFVLSLHTLVKVPLHLSSDSLQSWPCFHICEASLCHWLKQEQMGVLKAPHTHRLYFLGLFLQQEVYLLSSSSTWFSSHRGSGERGRASLSPLLSQPELQYSVADACGGISQSTPCRLLPWFPDYPRTEMSW